VDLKNHDVTSRLISYLNETSFDIRFAAIFALGRRGDPTAVEPLEAILKSSPMGIGVPHAVENLIEQLKSKGASQNGAASGQKNGDAGTISNNNQEVLDRLDHLEHQLTEMNDRLRRIEGSLPGSKSD
jgi:hypothetical protein